MLWANYANTTLTRTLHLLTRNHNTIVDNYPRVEGNAVCGVTPAVRLNRHYRGIAQGFCTLLIRRDRVHPANKLA